MYLNRISLIIIFLIVSTYALAQSQFPTCKGSDAKRWNNCYGIINFSNGDRYEGGFSNGKFSGWATYYHFSENQFKGDKYIGEFRNGQRHGRGKYFFSNGRAIQEGVWEQGKFLRSEKITLVNTQQVDNSIFEERKKIEIEKQRLSDERKLLDQERKRRENSIKISKLELQVTTSDPDLDGYITVLINTGTNTSSLKLNGEEQGASEQGQYKIKRLTKTEEDINFSIIASDSYGNIISKNIVVKSKLNSEIKTTDFLKPDNIKQVPIRDAVAIIIGIQDYKRLPRADYANEDARLFYKYAIRALGIKSENIKILIDNDGDQIEILKAFKSWLPSYVKKDKTDVYVFYSGHGLPAPDGKSLYFLSQGSDKDYLVETAVNQTQIIDALNIVKPKSVTLFIDTCYSGTSRSGEALLSNARPVIIKAKDNTYPSNFTVISASSFDQISSSSPELKHGIFSFYLMKGFEGEADENKDGKITIGELHSYLKYNVVRQAMKMNRKQEPQIIGDDNRVLVER